MSTSDHHDDLIAQYRSLRADLEKQSAEIKNDTDTLERKKADRDATARRCAALERFFDQENISQPMADKAGV